MTFHGSIEDFDGPSMSVTPAGAPILHSREGQLEAGVRTLGGP